MVNKFEMLVVFEKVYREWCILIDEKSDQRTKDLFLMSSPFYVLLTSVTYLILVKVRKNIIKHAIVKHLYLSVFKKFLHNFMKNREPPEKWKTYLQIYNMTHILGCTIFFIAVIYYMSTDETLKWRCIRIDRSSHGLPLLVSLDIFHFIQININMFSNFSGCEILLCVFDSQNF